MKQKERYGLIIGILILLLAEGCGVTPTNTAASTVAADATAEEILADARLAIDSAVGNAEASGHDLIAHTAYELDFAVQQLDHRLSGQRKAFFKDLDKTMQKALSEVANTTDRLERGVTTFRSIEDDLSLDLQATLGNIPFVKDPYILRRVDGVQQVLLNQSAYRLTFLGTGFGEVSAENKTTIRSFRVEGRDLTSSVQIVKRSRNRLVMEVPNTTLEPFFDDELKIASAKIVMAEMEREDDETDTWEVERTIPYEFRLYLHPRTAGKLEVSGEGERFGFVDYGSYCVNVRTANNHCSDDCDESDSFPRGRGYRHAEEKAIPNYKPVPPYEVGNRRLVAGTATHKRISGPGAWQKDPRSSVVENGRKLHFSVNTWTRPKTFKVCAAEERYQSLGTSPFEITMEVPYEDPFQIRTPKDPKLVIFELTLPSGKRFAGSIQEGRQYLDGRFEILRIEDVGNETVAIAQLKPPQHLLID